MPGPIVRVSETGAGEDPENMRDHENTIPEALSDRGDSIFSLLRDASENLPPQEWGSICLGAMVRVAQADAGLLLDRGGVTVAVLGLDDIESYELAMYAMSRECSESPRLVELERRSLVVSAIPLRADSRSTGVALLASEQVSFAERVQDLVSELSILGSALSASSPRMRGAL